LLGNNNIHGIALLTVQVEMSLLMNIEKINREEKGL
jgi:hypothetical protein